MSEHSWAIDQIAAAIAGGLNAAEAERFDSHIRECPDCAAALADGRRLDRGLGSLFTAVRPAPALEDRMIQALRTTKARDVQRLGWKHKLAWGIAASLALGVTGAGVSLIAGDQALPFPGASVSEKGLEQGPYQMANDRVADSSRMGAAPTAISQLDGFIKDSNSSIAFGERPTTLGLRGALKPTAPATSFRPEVLSDKSGPDRPDANNHHYYLTPPVPGGPAMPGLSTKPDDTTRYNEGLGFNPNWGIQVKPAQDGEREKLVEDRRKDVKSESKPTAAPVFAVADHMVPSPKVIDAPPAPESATPRKIVIRSGEVEFEVESFDSAVAAVTRLIGGIKNGYVATVNSEKLPNGKVKGSVVVRIPPEALDALVLDLRKELGKGEELKGQRIGSQDITKQYTDLESRLKAARTMEQRLLQIIKEGKGEIKQLLEAEKELGNWRTKIEEAEGELRYYGSQVALSTLTITMAEKEIRAAAGMTEIERVQAGLEVEDVDKALRDALAAVAEAKGRVTRSDLKQLAAGQFNAMLQFEVAPEASGPLRDRLRQIGRIARLEIDRVQTAEGGTPQRDAKVKRGDSQFQVQIYNLANIAPRETAVVQVAALDVPAAYVALRDAVGRAKGRVLAARLDENDRQNITAQLDFEVRRADEGEVRAALTAAGEVLSRTVSRAAETDNVTDSKVLYRTSLTSAARLSPRETTTLSVEVADVDLTAAAFTSLATEAKGRAVDANVAHERGGRVVAKMIYSVPLSAAPGLIERFKSAGTVRDQHSTRDPQAADGKYAVARLEVILSNSDLIVPKDDGLLPQVRKGLARSVEVLLFSISWLILGLCVVVPWALIGYGGYRLVRRLFFRTVPRSPTA